MPGDHSRNRWTSVEDRVWLWPVDGLQQKAADPTEIHLDPWMLPDACKTYRESKEEFSKSVTHHISLKYGLAACLDWGVCLIVRLDQGYTFQDDVFSIYIRFGIICIFFSCYQDLPGKHQRVYVCAILNTQRDGTDSSVRQSWECQLVPWEVFPFDYPRV